MITGKVHPPQPIHRSQALLLTFAADGGGTVMRWDWRVRPNGWLRLLGPLSGLPRRRMERRIWTGLKNQLEGHGRARSA